MTGTFDKYEIKQSRKTTKNSLDEETITKETTTSLSKKFSNSLEMILLRIKMF